MGLLFGIFVVIGACPLDVPHEDVAILTAHRYTLIVLIKARLQLKILSFETLEFHFLKALIQVYQSQSGVIRGDDDLFLAEEIDAADFASKSKFPSPVLAINFGRPIQAPKVVALIDIARAG